MWVRVPTRPTGEDSLEQPLQLARIHMYLSMAMPFLWMRQADTIGALGLALNACSEQNGEVETTGRIAALLETAAALWQRLGFNPSVIIANSTVATVRACTQ